MFIWQLHPGKLADALTIFSQMTPEQDEQDRGASIKLIGRWHDLVRGRGVAIYETDSAEAISNWALTGTPSWIWNSAQYWTTKRLASWARSVWARSVRRGRDLLLTRAIVEAPSRCSLGTRCLDATIAPYRPSFTASSPRSSLGLSTSLLFLKPVHPVRVGDLLRLAVFDFRAPLLLLCGAVGRALSASHSRPQHPEGPNAIPISSV
jgi:Protein of unknown function (DUF3303)